MDPVSAAASVIGIVQLTATIVKLCGVYASKVKDAKQDILRLAEEVDALRKTLTTLQDFMSGPDGAELVVHDDLLANIARCFTTLGEFEKKLDLKTTQRTFRRKLRFLKWPLEHEEVNRAIEQIGRYKTMFSLSLLIDQMKTTRILDKKLDFGSLRTAKGAAFDSYDNPHNECLPGTRVELLDAIETWATSEDGKCIFWLNGMAGTGKSTISRTIASRLKRQELLGASFFFKKGEEDRGTAKKLFSTLVEQLVVGLPGMVSGVQAAIKNDPNISEKVLREQFEKLFFYPLLEMRRPRTKIMSKVIVIDALDECDHEQNIQQLLLLLPQVQRSSSVQIRFLLTSRPELAIRLGFSSISTEEHQDMVLHEVPEPVVRHDISLYFDHQFARLRKERSLAPDWPGEEATRALIEKAIPLFISAFTLCRFIDDKNWIPEKRLKAILADQTTYLSKMDGVYMPVLNQLLTGQDESESRQLVREFKEIIGVIVILATPLSVNSLSRLLQISKDDINNRLGCLHSVLNIPNDTEKPVRLLHLSFRNCLLDVKKENSTFGINEKEVHRALTRLCLQNMERNLRKNICNLPNDGTPLSEIDMRYMDDYLPSDLRYSCRYWVQHLVQTQEPVVDVSRAFSFLKKHFLHWVEVMSILGFLSEAISLLALLQSIVQKPEMSANLHDMRRFVFRNRHVANIAPLQLYSSGLVFSPELSFVRKTFSGELPDWVLKPPTIRKNWTAEIQTLEDHSDSVNAVAFSPDSKVLATGSRDKTIKLWDTNTGALQQTLKGHSSRVKAVAFSLDGQTLVSGSEDNMINVWDTSAGAVQHSFSDRSGKMTSMDISPNGHLIAFGFNNGTIHLWDANTRVMRQTFKNHTGAMRAVSISPDGQLLVSSSHVGATKIWDISTGAIKDTLKGHFGGVLTVAFSPDGRLIAFGGSTLYLWNTLTSTLKHTIITRECFKRNSDFFLENSVVVVAFSPNSQVLASGSYDGRLGLWDVTTGALLQVLEGHRSLILAVRFSQDGQMLASSSYDRTVKLWDTTAGSLERNIQQTSPAAAAAAAAAATTTPAPQLHAAEYTTTLTGHSDTILTSAFSPSGQVLASGSVDCMVNLWSVTTGALLRNLRGHHDWVFRIVFSPDSQLLASGSGDGIIKLWRVSTGGLRQTLQGHSGGTTTMMFSPDNRLLISGSLDRSVRVWDADSGALMQSVAVQSLITKMAFSPHGACLETDRGNLDIQFEYESNHPVRALANSKRVSLEAEWVVLDGVRLLWLPSEYRPDSSAIFGCTVALGLASGEVFFMEFRP